VLVLVLVLLVLLMLLVRVRVRWYCVAGRVRQGLGPACARGQAGRLLLLGLDLRVGGRAGGRMW